MSHAAIFGEWYLVLSKMLIIKNSLDGKKNVLITLND